MEPTIFYEVSAPLASHGVTDGTHGTLVSPPFGSSAGYPERCLDTESQWRLMLRMALGLVQCYSVFLGIVP